MILIVTHTEDYTADFIVNKLNAQEISYVRWNCDRGLTNTYTLSNSRDFEPELIGQVEFDSVWFRRTKNPRLDIDNIGNRLYLNSEYESLLNNILVTVSTRKWLSEPMWVYRAENKALQLRIASDLGLAIPETLITNDKERIKEFCDRFSAEVVLKPMGSGRIYTGAGIKTIFTNKIKPEHLASLEDYDITPIILQEYIDKDYEIRLTVVDNEFFAAKVDSQKSESTKIDWRRDKTQFDICNLPNEVSHKCVALVNKLHLNFGAIDLIKSKSGEYYFLEINPNGQWAWIEIDTGLQISKSIINFLSSKHS